MAVTQITDTLGISSSILVMPPLSVELVALHRFLSRPLLPSESLCPAYWCQFDGHSQRRYRIHRHHSRRDKGPFQEPPPGCPQRLLAHHPLLHRLHHHHFPKRPLHLPRPRQRQNRHQPLHNHLHASRLRRRRKLHQRRAHDQRHIRSKPRTLRRLPPPLLPSRGRLCPSLLRPPQPLPSPLGSSPLNIRNQWPLLRSKLHRCGATLVVAAEYRRRLKPTLLGVHLHILAPLPLRYQAPESRTSLTLQELDVSVRSYYSRGAEYRAYISAGVELL